MKVLFTTTALMMFGFYFCILADQLGGAVVRVGINSNRDNPACGTISLNQTYANQKVEVTCELYGQYLSIELPGTGDLHVCEVKADRGQCEGKQSK